MGREVGITSCDWGEGGGEERGGGKEHNMSPSQVIVTDDWVRQIRNAPFRTRTSRNYPLPPATDHDIQSCSHYDQRARPLSIVPEGFSWIRTIAPLE